MSAPTPGRVFAAPRTNDFVFSPVRERSRGKTFELVPVATASISMGMKITDPVRTVIADEATLLAWVATALPGARSIYHVGHLASDRSQDTSRLAAPERAALNRIAHLVMSLVEQGVVIAVQQRLDDGQIAYVAIKARPPAVRSRALRGQVPTAPQRWMPADAPSGRTATHQSLSNVAGDAAAAAA